MYNKKLIESKKLEEENEKFIFFNNENKQIVKPIQPPDEKKPEPIRKRQSLFNFVNRVNIIIREIKEEKDLNANEQNRLYAMQEDINYIVDHLK